jgi:CobQ-like glutamine amidotransferase family enzyme
MLMICGLYQLFGHNFRAANGDEMAGISLFDATTVAGQQRLIGNITIKTSLGQVIGYENHSGLTKLTNNQTPFGQVISGAGNNGDDDTEGAREFNVFGSYLHGPILPKNPALADELLRLAAEKKFGQKSLTPHSEKAAIELQVLNETAEAARQAAMKRPR